MVVDRAVARRVPSRPGLSRDRILAAALRLVDQDGLEALSMRRLGTELGVEAMSLYNHVPSKDALLDGIAEKLWSEVTVPASADWRRAVRDTARSLRRVGHQHPRAFPLLLERSALSAPALRVIDDLLAALRDAGFRDRDAMNALGAIVAYATGYVLVEQVCALGQPEVARRALAPKTLERYGDTARALCECDPEAQFEFGLGSLIAGMAARIGRSPRLPRS